MNRLRAAWRRHRAHRAYVRALTAQRLCCGGQCTTADNARVLAQLPPVHVPRERTTKEAS